MKDCLVIQNEEIKKFFVWDKIARTKGRTYKRQESERQTVEWEVR